MLLAKQLQNREFKVITPVQLFMSEREWYLPKKFCSWSLCKQVLRMLDLKKITKPELFWVQIFGFDVAFVGGAEQRSSEMERPWARSEDWLVLHTREMGSNECFSNICFHSTEYLRKKKKRKALHITDSSLFKKTKDNLVFLLIRPVFMLITAISCIVPPQISLERELSMTHCCFPLNVLLQKNKRKWWVCAKATGTLSKKRPLAGMFVLGAPSNKLSPLVDRRVLSRNHEICAVCSSPFFDN